MWTLTVVVERNYGHCFMKMGTPTRMWSCTYWCHFKQYFFLYISCVSFLYHVHNKLAIVNTPRQGLYVLTIWWVLYPYSPWLGCVNWFVATYKDSVYSLHCTSSHVTVSGTATWHHCNWAIYFIAQPPEFYVRHIAIAQAVAKLIYLIDTDEGEEELDWTPIRHIKLSNVKYPSKAKYFCVRKGTSHPSWRWVCVYSLELTQVDSVPSADESGESAQQSSSPPSRQDNSTDQGACDWRQHYYPFHL